MAPTALAGEFESTLARLSETVSAVRSATSEILDGVTDLAERTSEESNAVSVATNQLGAFAGTNVQKTAKDAAEQAVGMAQSAEEPRPAGRAGRRFGAGGDAAHPYLLGARSRR